MATRVRDLAIPDELDREIGRESADRATWSALATELLEEALRMRRAPGVVESPESPTSGAPPRFLLDEGLNPTAAEIPPASCAERSTLRGVGRLRRGNYRRPEGKLVACTLEIESV